MMKPTRTLLWLALMIAGVTLAACQPAPAAEPEGADQPAGPDATAEANVELPEREWGSGSFELTDGAVGLEALSAYSAVLETTFDGTLDGQPLAWARTYTFARLSDPAGQMLSIESSGSEADEAASGTLLAEVAGVGYTRQPDGLCASEPISADGALAWPPASALPSVIGAAEAGQEEVSGIAATRYTFDQQATTFPQDAAASGEVWVAQEGGYVVKYTLSVEGALGEGVEGTATWAYTLDPAGTFDLPADCVILPLDAPLTADASDVQRGPGTTFFHTQMTPPETAAFYQEQLPALGWEPAGDPLLADDHAVLKFAQGDEILSVLVVVKAAGTEVILMQGVPPEF